MILAIGPETQRMIEDQVRSGRFPTPEAVVEAAVEGLCELDGDELDEQTIAAINEAEAQADRGEGVELDEFRAQFNKRVGA